MEKQDGETFPRQLRLTIATDFRQVFNNNFRQADTGITILVAKRSGANPRVGFAIAKKQIQKAVHRNRLKRFFRESFRRNQHRLPSRDIVIMVRRQILQIDRAQLAIDLEKHWNSIIKQCEKL